MTRSGLGERWVGFGHGLGVLITTKSPITPRSFQVALTARSKSERSDLIWNRRMNDPIRPWNALPQKKVQWVRGKSDLEWKNKSGERGFSPQWATRFIRGRSRTVSIEETNTKFGYGFGSGYNSFLPLDKASKCVKRKCFLFLLPPFFVGHINELPSPEVTYLWHSEWTVMGS